MWLTQTLRHVSSKNLNRDELLKDLEAFSALQGDDGDRVLDHLCAKFKAFDVSDNKDLFKAGYDEGVRAVLIYMAYAREDYNNLKEKVAK